jgi:hypothetical protein
MSSDEEIREAYQPDLQAEAVKTALQQAGFMCADWV